MARNLGLAFSLSLVVLFAWTLFQAQNFRSQARLFPLIIGIVGLALALLQLGLELRRRDMSTAASPAGEARDGGGALPLGEQQEPMSPELRRRRTAIILGWILGFTLTVWLLGFPLAVPVATLAYVRFGAGESWPVSAVFAGACGVLFYGLFVYVVHIPFDEGILQLLWFG